MFIWITRIIVSSEGNYIGKDLSPNKVTFPGSRDIDIYISLEWPPFNTLEFALCPTPATKSMFDPHANYMHPLSTTPNALTH